MKARRSPKKKQQQQQQLQDSSPRKTITTTTTSSLTNHHRTTPKRLKRKRKQITTTNNVIVCTVVTLWFIAIFYMISHLNRLKTTTVGNDSTNKGNLSVNNNKTTISIQEEQKNHQKPVVVMDVHAAVGKNHQHSIHHEMKKQHHEDHFLEAIPRREAKAAKNNGGDGDIRIESSSHLIPYESPLLIFTCHRAEYLKETMENVLKYLPNNNCEIGCPIIISQDGNDEETTKLIQSIQQKHSKRTDIPIIHLHHKHEDDIPRKYKQFAGYYALAKHYGWALDQVFTGKVYDNNNNNQDFLPLPMRIIILEEDLRIAPDFFHYMKATASILDMDTNLLAVSAFNDNGKKGMVQDERRILRSDFFPGLGWMMNRELWTTELSSKWPECFWDDWLREPIQRKGRHILHPEISRTFHFGSKGGASGNQFGGHLYEIQLQDSFYDFTSTMDNLEYMLSEETYNYNYWELISEQSQLVTTKGDNDNERHLRRHSQDVIIKAKDIMQKDGVNVRIEYTSQSQFARYARSLQLMDDEKAGIPRTAYKGIVETRPFGNEYFLFLTPPLDQVKEALLLQ